MKLLKDLFSRLFPRGGKVGLKIRVSDSQLRELELIRTRSGCKSDDRFFWAVIALSSRCIESLERGYSIAEIDVEANSYTEFDLSRVFPNFKRPPAESSVDPDIHQRAMAHYEWSRTQALLGYEVGARRGDEFERAPAFND